MKQNRQTRVGLGAASLIMILLVLCLVLMGVLSLMSARADLDLSRRHAKLAEGYAEASAAAQRALAELDALLAEAHAKSTDEAQYAALCTDTVKAGGASVEWEDDVTAALYLDAGEERQIEVRVERIPWSIAAKTRFTITSYRLIDAKEWEQTESLILMDM